MPLDQNESLLDVTMPLGDHLEELRRRLIFAGIGILAAAVVTFTFGFRLIGWLALPMVQAQDLFGFPPQTITTEPTAGFTSVYLPVALIAAVILASPWVIFQIWQFIVVGLYEHERRTVYLLAPFSTVMTALAVAFAYYVLLPVSLMFFLSFATYYPDIQPGPPNPVMRILVKAYGGGQLMKPDTVEDDEVLPAFPIVTIDPAEPGEGSIWINQRESKLKAVVGGRVRTVALQSDRMLNPMPQLGEYVRFAAVMILGVVVAFQLPVVMLVMGWTGLFDPRAIAMLRKYAVFAAFTLGAILTPTDIFSMLVLAVPLYLLFEFGLLLMKIANRKKTTPPFPSDT